MWSDQVAGPDMHHCTGYWALACGSVTGLDSIFGQGTHAQAGHRLGGVAPYIGGVAPHPLQPICSACGRYTKCIAACVDSSYMCTCLNTIHAVCICFLGVEDSGFGHHSCFKKLSLIAVACKHAHMYHTTTNACV